VEKEEKKQGRTSVPLLLASANELDVPWLLYDRVEPRQSSGASSREASKARTESMEP
jgi:hypothetical protein